MRLLSAIAFLTLFAMACTVDAAPQAAPHQVDIPLANGVLHALVSMLTVDSNFSNSQVESLATQLGSLAGPASTFITAPTQVASGSEVLDPAPSDALWSAVKNGTI